MVNSKSARCTYKTKIESVQVYIFVGSRRALSQRRVLHVKPSCTIFAVLILLFSFLHVVCSKTFSIAENSCSKFASVHSIKKKSLSQCTQSEHHSSTENEFNGCLCT